MRLPIIAAPFLRATHSRGVSHCPRIGLIQAQNGPFETFSQSARQEIVETTASQPVDVTSIEFWISLFAIAGGSSSRLERALRIRVERLRKSVSNAPGLGCTCQKQLYCTLSLRLRIPQCLHRAPLLSRRRRRRGCCASETFRCGCTNVIAYRLRKLFEQGYMRRYLLRYSNIWRHTLRPVWTPYTFVSW